MVKLGRLDFPSAVTNSSVTLYESLKVEGFTDSKATDMLSVHLGCSKFSKSNVKSSTALYKLKKKNENKINVFYD